jgi:hypothetical protein
MLSFPILATASLSVKGAGGQACVDSEPGKARWPARRKKNRVRLGSGWSGWAPRSLTASLCRRSLSPMRARIKVSKSEHEVPVHHRRPRRSTTATNCRRPAAPARGSFGSQSGRACGDLSHRRIGALPSPRRPALLCRRILGASIRALRPNKRRHAGAVTARRQCGWLLCHWSGTASRQCPRSHRVANFTFG